MTTSNTTTFNETCDEIIADALANVGAIGPGRTAKGFIRAHAFKALNRVAKKIDANGDFLWRTARRSIAITAGTASYGPTVLGTDVIGLQDPASFQLTGQDSRTVVYAQSNADYRSLSNRTSTGTPVNFLVERTLAGCTLTLWPVPDNAGTLEVFAALRAKDFVTGADTPDFDQKWISALILGTSAEIAPAYGQDPSGFRDDFAAELDRLVNQDTERVGLTLVPFGGGNF